MKKEAEWEWNLSMLNIEGGNKVTQGGREGGRWREGGEKGLGREDRQAES